jgi:hypothetical protein
MRASLLRLIFSLVGFEFSYANCRLVARAGLLLSSGASSTYKALRRSPSFTKSAQLKRPFIRSIFLGSDQEYAVGGKASPFEALKVLLDTNESIAPPSYDEMARRHQVRTVAVKTDIHRLRKCYTELLHEEVGRTVSYPAEIDEEIHALCEALIATEGRLVP